MSRSFYVRTYRHDPAHTYELIVAAVGFEARAVYLAEKLSLNATRRVCIGFEDRQVLNFARNRQIFVERGFEYFEAPDESFKSLFRHLIEQVAIGDGDTARIAIDISCFNRFRLAAIIETLNLLPTIGRNVIVDFLYVIAAFSPPSEQAIQNTHVGPVSPEFAGWTTDPTLPPAAVIGLGYEQDKALGAVDHLQITHVLTFVPRSPVEEYFTAVKEANASLLETLKSTNVFDYRVHDPVETFYTLESVVSGLVNSYNPILLPFGPKIFSICALLVAVKHDNCAVWRVSGGDLEVPSDRLPSDHVVGLTVEYRVDS